MIEIITISSFEKGLKRLKKKYHSITHDYENLLHELTANPYSGIDLGKGLHKVRMAITNKGKGKSHGARVITYTEAIVSIEEGRLILLYIYDKAERESISDKELEELLKQIKE